MLMKSNFRQCAGFTLAELMIALVLNAIIFTALIAIFMANINHYNASLSANRFNQQLQAIMELMASDIRRAGYWANANGDIGTNQNNNPFMNSVTGTDIVTGASNTCILFTYDHASTGVLPAVSSASDDDRYGYQLINQTIQTRPWGAAFTCPAAASAWENVLDPSIVVTNLTFTLNTQTITTGPASQGIILRSVDISLTAYLASNSTVTKTLTQHVRIRNDKFIP